MEAGLPADFPRLKRVGATPPVRQIHLGLGAFFRAHGAIWTQEADPDWGILGVSLMSPMVRNALRPQGGAYIALELGPDGETAQAVEIITDVLVAREDPESVLAAMSDGGVDIVSLTVTEKGYCYEPSTGALNLSHPDIIHDLTAPLPRSAIGYLVRAYERRMQAGLPAFTAMSCDNLPENGRLLKGVVMALAQRIDPLLAEWIARNAAFPSTMVDRIVPATKDEDIARVSDVIGAEDAAPVIHEPFRQWVIEDCFAGPRPDYAAVGVQMVDDVTPYEHMKLRMLNGAHSSLAYLGYLAGHETISDTVADPIFAQFVKDLWAREIIPVLTPPPGADLTAYAEALFARFCNPSIRHRTWQIAMDGSQKLPQRILSTLNEATAPTPGLMLAVAGWMRYVGGRDENGQAIDVKDPMAERLKALSEAEMTREGKVAALLSVREIFPAAQATALLAPVTSAYQRLNHLGARQAISEIKR
jgi:fructuronate reductase